MRPPPSPHWSSLYPSLDLSDGLSDDSLVSPLYTGGPGFSMELNRANSMPPTAWSSQSPRPTSSYGHSTSRSNQAIADASHESLMEHRNLAYIRMYEENRSLRGLVNKILEALPRLNHALEDPSHMPSESSGPGSCRYGGPPTAAQTGDRPLPDSSMLNNGSALFKFGATSELQLGVAYWNIPLDRDFYRQVKFWTLGDYTKEKRAEVWDELDGETQKVAHLPYLFLQKPDGVFISPAESRGLNHAICGVFRDLAVDPRYPIAGTSSEIPMAHMQYMYSVIYPAWPIVRYCDGHWKLNLVVTKIYSSWKTGYLDTGGKKKRSASSSAPDANVEPQTKRRRTETSSTGSSTMPLSHYNTDTSSAPEPVLSSTATPLGETQSTSQAGTSDQNIPTPPAPSETNPREEPNGTTGSSTPETSGGTAASNVPNGGAGADTQVRLPPTETEGAQRATNVSQSTNESSQPSPSAPAESAQQALLTMIEGSANPAPVRLSSTPPPESLNNPLDRPLSTVSPAPAPSKPKTRGAQQKKAQTTSEKDGAIFKPTKHNSPMMICGRDYMRDHPEAVGKMTKGDWRKIWDPISRNADAMKALEQRAIEYKEAKKKR